MNILNTHSKLLEKNKPIDYEKIKKQRTLNAKNALNDQWSDIYALKLNPPAAWLRWGLWMFLLVFVTFLLWASFFNLDEVTTASGKVVPTSREQIIQSMEPGVITAILVKEGEIVEQDQALIRIDDVRLGSNVQETKARINAMQASAIRLRNESSGRKQLNQLDFKGINKELIDNEINTFNAKKRTLEASLSTLFQAYKLNQEELKITEPLAAKGLVSDIEVLKIQRTLEDIKGKINEINEKYKSDSTSELARIEGELGSHQATLVGKNDALKRTVIKAPKKGIVKNIRISTIGAVVQTGQDLLEIVPVEESLYIETRIRPTDIAFLRPGLHAIVKLTAYDSGIYGWLDAELIQISPDTLRDEIKRDEIFYRAVVKTNASTLKTPKGDLLPIIPGMQAQVDIKTGQKSVLSYIFKPILRVREAFRER